MILRPQKRSSVTAAGFIPAWQAVAATQKATSANFQLVRQPDHARLSGQIAEHLAITGAPAVDDDIVRGIGLHDEGWADFDSGLERLRSTPAGYSATNVTLSAEGNPLSFLEIKAGDFLRAWCGSIESAETVAPIAGLIVSAHFRRIGVFGMGLGAYSGDDTQRVREFITREEERERRLLRLQSRSREEVEYWTDVLQFCDLLSLYLCCGAGESVEFPQAIGPKGEMLKVQLRDDVYELSPSPFMREIKFSLQARQFPSGDSTELSWRLR